MEAHNLDIGGQMRIGDCLVDPARGVIESKDGAFRIEPKVMEVLCALARAQGKVLTRAELIEEIWQVEFGGDESLTRAVSILRRSLGDDRCIETIPKRGYRLVAPATPVGEERAAPKAGASLDEPPPAAEAEIRPIRKWTLVAAAAAIGLVAAVAIVGFWRGDRVVRGVVQNGRVEVRAFDVLAKNDDAATRFAGGLHDALVHILAGSGVETASPAGAIPSVDAVVRPSEFAVAGSIDLNDDGYLVTVNIEEQKKGGLVLWSEQFKQAGDAPVALQTRIASNAAGVLRCGLANRGPHVGEMTPEVFSLWLQACALFGGADKFVEMHDLARRIVAAAPDLAESHSLSAATSALMGREGAIDPEEAEAYFAEARKEAARALELDPQTGDPYFALALATPDNPTHLVQREAYLRKVGPRGAYYQFALTQLVGQARASGRIEEAIALLRRAYALDPYTPLRMTMLAWVLASNGALREADTLLDRAEALWPNSPTLTVYRLNIAAWREPHEVAERMLSVPDAFPQDMTDEDIECRKALVDARWQGALVAFADRLAGSSCFGLQQAEFRARLYAMAGDVDAAYGQFERIDFNRWDLGPMIFLFYPEMRAVRRDPRFMPFAARIGLVDYWLKTDRWPDFCAEPDLPYDCKKAARSAQARNAVANDR